MPRSRRRVAASLAVALAGAAILLSGLALEGLLPLPWRDVRVGSAYPPHALDGPHVLQIVSLTGHAAPGGRSLDVIEAVVQPVPGQVVRHASKTQPSLETERSSTVIIPRPGGGGWLTPLRDRDGSMHATPALLNDDDLATGRFPLPDNLAPEAGAAFTFSIRPWLQRWESVDFLVPHELVEGAVVRLR